MAPTILPKISNGPKYQGESFINNGKRKKVILFSRHGESQFNQEDKIGGNSTLSSKGVQYSVELAKYINSLNIQDLTIWTSSLKRTIATASKINCSERFIIPELNELDAGVCECLTYKEVKEKYPEDFMKRDLNKLEFRYQKGESYLDVMERVKNIIKEIKECDGNLLIVSHQAVLRCLFGLLLNIDQEEIPYLEIRLHALYSLEENKLKSRELHLPCVSNYLPNPNILNSKVKEQSKLISEAGVFI